MIYNLIVLALVFIWGPLLGAYGWWARGCRCERQQFDAQIQGYQTVLTERQAAAVPSPRGGRHAAGPGRRPGAHFPESPAAAPPQPNPNRTRLVTAPKPKTGATTARDIRPVRWPLPAGLDPQPTSPMRTLTTTGELRAISTSWLATYRAECEADRREVAQALAGQP